MGRGLVIERLRRRYGGRDTIDTVALWFAATTCVVIVVVALGVVVMAVAGRLDEVDNAVELIARVISSIVLVLLGLIAGRVTYRGDESD